MHHLLEPCSDSNRGISSPYEHWHNPDKKTKTTPSLAPNRPSWAAEIQCPTTKLQTNSKKENAMKIKKKKRKKPKETCKKKNEKDRK